MDHRTAINSIGKKVDSSDAGNKMIRSVPEWHGPYVLENVAKDGMCILSNGRRVASSLLRLSSESAAATTESKEPK